MRYLSKCLLLFVLLPIAVAGALTLFETSAEPPRFSTQKPPAPAAGRLLVASRDMSDPYFRHSVIYLLAHGDEGSVGLIVNHSTGIALSQILTEESKAAIGVDNAALHEARFGGPVLLSQLAMLLRDQTDRSRLHPISDQVFFSDDRSAIERVLKQRQSDNRARFYVGHAGWSPGQLERELLRGGWFVADADTDSIFADDLEGLWDQLIRKLDPPGVLAKSGNITIVAANAQD